MKDRPDPLGALDSLRAVLDSVRPPFDTFVMPPHTAARLREGLPKGGIFGVRIVEDSSATKRMQVRFPKSKKRRIRKKWRKDPRNWRDVPTIYAFKSRPIVTPFVMKFEPLALRRDSARDMLRFSALMRLGRAR